MSELREENERMKADIAAYEQERVEMVAEIERAWELVRSINASRRAESRIVDNLLVEIEKHCGCNREQVKLIANNHQESTC